MANEKDNPGAARDAGARKEGTEEARNMERDTQASTRRAAEAAREMGEDMGRPIRAAAEQSSATSHRIAEQGTETGRRMADQGAETGRRAIRAGADMTQKGTEALRDTVHATAGTAQRISEQTANQFSRMFGISASASEEVAQQTSHNLDVMLQCGTILADGFQNIWREWMSYAQEAMQLNMNGINNMMRSRTVQDFYAAQSDLLKDEMETLLSSSVKISEMSARVANDAAQHINNGRQDQRRRI